MGCFSCVSKQSDAGEQYGQPMQCTLELAPLTLDSQEDLKAANNNVSSEQQPLTQTKVKTSKSGNTVTVTKITRTVNRTTNTRLAQGSIEIQRPKTPEIPIILNEGTSSSSSPLTKTKVKKSKNGKTVTVVKTTYSSNVINAKTTTPKTINLVVTGEQQQQELTQESNQNERVYRTTVAPMPQTKKRKRFNLKSILDRRPKREVVVDPRQSVEDLYNFEQRCLDIHNRLRALHGVKPLTLNNKMSAYAMEWAKHLAKKNKIKHRKQNKFGENLAFSSGSSYSVEDAVQAWYDEMENYDYKNPTISGNTGHFTQVVWKESSQLGVGMVQKNDRTWVVCNYDPPGNVLGKFEDNVPRPKGRQPKPQPSRLITTSKTENDRRPRTPTNLQTAKPQNEQRADDKPTTSQAFKKIIGNKHDKWSKFEMECLEEHNKRRALHGCEPMVLNRNLCNLANDWAIHLTKTRSMYHRPGNDYGENIYQLINRDPTAEDAVKAWYDEINKYKYSKPGFSTGTGHFTQVVWVDTKEMGVGRAKVDNMTFIVCNYNPPGNVMGQYKTQVPPVGGFKYPNKKDCSDAGTTSGANETHSTSNKKSGFFSNWFKSKK
ncbi:uncharacterized protein [Musca autumnalis]|uniref:uncharacterized protein n=1 Tax=Musca autumnalis TaxID=221902 RepID=UPI003CEE8ACD